MLMSELNFLLGNECTSHLSEVRSNAKDAAEIK